MHHVPAPANGTGHGIAPGQAFAQYRDVRHDIEVSLRAAQTGAEPGDHFVEDQQGIEFVAQRPQLSVEVGVHRTRAAFRTKRFDHNGCGATTQTVDLQPAAQSVEIIRRAFLSVRGGASRDPHRFHAPGARQAHAIDQLVAPAVVGAADLDHPFLAGIGAGQANSGHDRFGARAQQAQHVDTRHRFADQFSQFDLVFMQQAGYRPALIENPVNLFANGRVIGAQQRRATCLQEVGVAIAIHVGQVRTVGLGEGQWERIVERQVVLHAPRYDLFGGLGKALRSLAALVEIAHDFVHRVALDRANRLFHQLVEAAIE
ncbi:hypothetical protein ALQ76_05450 [Pseudomonas syringae pv. atrofaciens]|nr:hypothetical protein ALQ76_05450 [Pseudomonas syringae pv. atrofaciens]